MLMKPGFPRRPASLLILLGILFSVTAIGQNNDNLSPSSLTRFGEVLPPSPNASSIGKYGGIPVNFSSGRPNINIPLYDIKTPNLHVPVSLAYSTSGFGVNEIASRVGHSWTLHFGGVITRTVLDGPDELSQHIPLPPNYGTADNIDILHYLEAVEQSSYDLADCQYDIFSFNFGPYQGKFILDGNNIVLLQNENLQIKTSLVDLNYINGCTFEVLTPDGTAYYFGGPDATEYSGSESFGLNCGGQKDFNMNQTAWYLKKIVHPTGDLIEFTYSPVNFSYLSQISESQTRPIRMTEFLMCGQEAPVSTSNSTCVTELISFGVKLDRVTTTSGQTVDIEYQSREDLPGDVLVKNIIVYKYNSTSSVFKKFELSYEQSTSINFINTWNNQNDLKKHVFLQSITEKDASGNASKGQHVFEYNAINELPPRLSFAQDYWGFFNGKPNSTLVYITPEGESINNSSQIVYLFTATADRNSDATFAQKGLLKKISYPTGGYDEISYESHQHRFFERQTTNEQNLTVSPAGVNNSDLTPLVVEGFLTPNQQQTVPLVVTCNYIGTGSYDPPADRLEFSVINVTDNNTPIYLDQTLEAGNNNPNSFNSSLNLMPGKTYKIIVKIYGEDVAGGASVQYKNYDVTHVWTNRSEGGVRVGEVKSVNMNKTENIRRYYYVPLEDFSFASCDVIGYDFNNLSHYRTLASCGAACAVNEVQHYTLSSSSNFNIAKLGGNPISYRSVIESHGADFENGAIEYKYTMEADIDPERVYGINHLPSAFTGNEIQNGLLLSKRVLKKTPTAWIPRTEEMYTYKQDARVNTDFNSYTIRQNYIVLCYIQGMLFQTDFANKTPFDVMKYQHRKRWVYPDLITTNQYSEDGSQVISSHVTNEHANTHNIKPSKSTATTSSSDLQSKKTTFARDIFQINQPQWLTALSTAGFTEAPIEELILRKTGNTEYVTGGQLFIYDNTTLKPAQIYVLDLPAPVLLSSFTQCAVVNGSLNFDARYKKEMDISYNSTYGTTATIEAPAGKKTFIYDYHQSLPIAEVINASVSNIAYTSFETESLGGWNLNGGSTISSSSAFSGNRSLNGGVSKTVPTGTYIVSVWSTGNTSINGQPQTQTPLKTIGSWKLFELKLTNVSSIIISGDNIDEVRLFPEGAKMTTYTYEPLVGIINQCDATNQVTYYEYDSFGRLKTVKDENKNILKTYDYQFMKNYNQ